VAAALGTAVPADLAFTGVSTDSRAVRSGELFVALAGERFDAHQFLPQAAQGGARAAVVRRGTAPVPGLVLLPVDDTLSALGRLARSRRRDVPGPVVAVTGSNGKTATRAMLKAALSTRWRTHATRENLNNLVGVPLTVLEAADDVEALVVECGASVPGEVARLRDVVEPTVGVVTNVSAAHLAGFGSQEQVMKEKVSLLEGVSLGVVGQRPPELAARARAAARRVTVAGLAPGADFSPDTWHVNERGRPVLTVQGTHISLPLVGRHQAENATVVLAVCRELGLDVARVGEALAQVELPHGRCEIVSAGGLTLINDTYNANPVSLAAALEVARSIRGNRPLVILVGTMLELGEDSRGLHEEMARQVVAAGPDLIGAVGEFVPPLERQHLGARLLTAADADALGRAVAGRLEGGELVLLKASRGVQMEKAIPHLIGGRETTCSTTS
jgi:UDP-N-acetylmuramoyl-tripeptide--D-alanyl-D-alanine ligase